VEDQFCLMTEISIDISDAALKKPEKLSKSILGEPGKNDEVSP